MAENGNKMDIDNWATQLRKGVLELGIFSLLSEGEMYGYDLVKRLAGIKGLMVTEGTVYPLLSRLKKIGMLDSRLEESSSGPARKYYSLTREGRKALTLMSVYWKELVEGVNSLLESEEKNG